MTSRGNGRSGVNLARISLATAALVTGLLLVSGALTATKSLASPGLAAPDQPGPYKVGFTTFASTVGNNLPTKITVWYPHCAVGDAGCSSNPPGTPTYPLTIFIPPNPQIIVNSPLGALENAFVQQGSFPFIVRAHGGPAYPSTRERQMLADFKLMVG